VLSILLFFPDLTPDHFFLFTKLKITMKGTIFEAVSSIQQNVTRELKAIREEALSGTFFRCMSDVNVTPKRAGLY
jgi:hypothetical protein